MSNRLGSVPDCPQDQLQLGIYGIFLLLATPLVVWYFWNFSVAYNRICLIPLCICVVWHFLTVCATKISGKIEMFQANPACNTCILQICWSPQGMKHEHLWCGSGCKTASVLCWNAANIAFDTSHQYNRIHSQGNGKFPSAVQGCEIPAQNVPRMGMLNSDWYIRLLVHFSFCRLSAFSRMIAPWWMRWTSYEVLCLSLGQ